MSFLNLAKRGVPHLFSPLEGFCLEGFISTYSVNDRGSPSYHSLSAGYTLIHSSRSEVNDLQKQLLITQTVGCTLT